MDERDDDLTLRPELEEACLARGPGAAAISAGSDKDALPERQTCSPSANRPLLLSSSIPSPNKGDRVKGLILTREHFIRVPLTWLSPIYCASGGWAAIRVAGALWYYAGSRKTDTVQLNLSRLQAFGLDRRMTATEGLATLERLGLVRVTRRGRKSAIVTILRPDLAPPPDEEHGRILAEKIRAELRGETVYVLRCARCRRSPKFLPTEWQKLMRHSATRHRKAFEKLGQAAIEVGGSWEPVKRTSVV